MQDEARAELEKVGAKRVGELSNARERMGEEIRLKQKEEVTALLKLELRRSGALKRENT